MTGTTAREEARKSLQALLSAGKENTLIAPENGNHQDEEGGLRRRFRADIQRALRRPPSEARVAEQRAVESQVRRLLEVVQSSPGVGKAPVPAAGGEDEDEDEGEEPSGGIGGVGGFPDPDPVAIRSLTRKEEGSLADALRTQVADARKRLFTMDGKVTVLTRELKLGRSQIWAHQQGLSTAESRACKVMEERAKDLDPGAREEEAELEKQERELAQQLGEARANAARWSSVAKRQDTMLQQERESQRGNDAQSILARHPAGEVFLTRCSRDESDDDSEDDRYARARYARQQEDEGVSLGSDDSEDDLQVPRAPGGGSADARGVSKDCPPAPPAQHRGLAPPNLRVDTRDDDSASEGGSSLPTPTSSASSPVRSSAGVSPAKRAGGAININGGAAGTPTGTTVDQVGSMHPDDDSDSDEEAGRPVQKKAEVKVPPLPELKGIGNRGRPPLREEDNAEEVSSEEGLSTSRSV